MSIFYFFPLQTCSPVWINWITAYAVESLWIMDLKRNEQMEIQPSTSHSDILVVWQFAVSIGETSPECCVVSLIYQEMRAMERGKGRKHPPISSFSSCPGYSSDCIPGTVLLLLLTCLEWLTHIKKPLLKRKKFRGFLLLFSLTCPPQLF